MAPVNRSADTEATPSTIWKTCFAPMKFEEWDPDVKELGNVSGGCVNGTTFDFCMKDGQTIPCALSNVVENESLTFGGSAYGGMIKCEGKILLKPVDGSDAKTNVDYTFEISGFLGGIANFFGSKQIIEGTEHGLENIVKLSAEAEKAS